MKKITIEKYITLYGENEKSRWLCYCDKFGKHSCYGDAKTPKKALKMFLQDYKEFSKIVKKRRKHEFPNNENK